jgi:molybdopterin-guanine dinucleotide biosynthesis protein A
MRTALVLAGGRGLRIGGNKAATKLDGMPLLQWVIDAVQPLADRVVLSIAPEQVLPTLRCRLPTLVCEDLLPGRGPLGGILSGMQAAGGAHAFTAPCDAPFLQRDLLELLWSARNGYDAVVPVVGGRPQPLVAVYGRSCITPIELALNGADYSMRRLLRDLAVRYVPEDDVRRADPELLSFNNVNTRTALARAERAIAAVG